MFFPSSSLNRRHDTRGRGGKSRVEASREETIEKLRAEREQRKRVKLENKSSVTIQAFWRGWSSKSATRKHFREIWTKDYGCDGNLLQPGDCLGLGAGGALGALLFFYNPDTDWVRLASAARVIANSSKSEAFAAFIAAYNSLDDRAVLLYRLKALALQCLDTLVRHRYECAAVLAAARPAAPLDPSACSSPAAPLQECLLLLVSPDTYTAALGKPQATTLAAAVLSHVAEHGLGAKLYRLLTAATLPPPPSVLAAQLQGGQAASQPHEQGQEQGHDAAQQHQHHTHHSHHHHHHAHAHSGGHGAPAVAAKPYVEALVTQLTVRLLSLKGWSPCRPEDSLHWLLCVPGLWHRAASLHPVAPRVCRSAVAWLAASGPHRLASMLPGGSEQQAAGSSSPMAAAAAASGTLAGAGLYLPGGRGAAVAVLIANLLAVGPKLLQPDKSVAAAPPAVALRAPALALCRVLHALIALLPLDPFFPDVHAAGGGAAGGDNADEDEVDEAEACSVGLTRLTLEPVPHLPLETGTAAAAAGAVAAGGGKTGAGNRGAQSGGGGQGGSSSSNALLVLPQGLLQQVQAVTEASGRQVLKQLVGVLLPQAAPPAAPTGGAVVASSLPVPLPHAASLPRYGSTAPPSTAALLEAAEGAHALSDLVWALAQLPGQRQKVMLGLAVSADLVERLWWSFLRPVRLAELCGITWLPDVEPVGEGGSPPGTRASVSACSSYTTSGAMPMEVEMPGGSPGIVFSRSSSGGGANMGFGMAAAAAFFGDSSTGGNGGGGGASGDCTAGGGGGGWRPRVAEELGWLLPLTVACAVFYAHVTTSTLDEFYGGAQRPLVLQQLYDPVNPEAGFLSTLRDSLWHVLWSDYETEHSAAGEALYGSLARAGGQLYGVLYERNCRRAFCPAEVFHATALAPERFLTEASSSRSSAGREDGSCRVWRVLEAAPALVPFAERARLFQLMVAREREEYRSQEESRFLEMGMLEAGLGNRFVPIRRDSLLFDGFDRLNAMGERLKGRVRIAFIDAHGVPEAGVDGGGLFKDFMEELMRAGLSAEYGLFASNTAHQLYPNPAALRLVEDAPRLLAFLGRMLGKAVYENVLLELPLAGFFLKKFRGAHCDLNDLPTLDPELYRSLLRLRDHFQQHAPPPANPTPATSAPGTPAATHDPTAHPAAAAASTHAPAAAAAAPSPDLDLGLTFTVADEVAAALGDPGAEVELKPRGRHIPVTADNVREYIHRVAHYKLNISPRPAVSAFLSGFYELIPRSWVAMFNGEELQTLISGSDERLDLEDMRQHIEYAGGYHEDHPVVHCLWEALASFTPEEQRAFLKFVTACSRAPLLGFKYLEPRLCVQLSGSMLDPSAPNRLPTASTCMNLLKLPPYRSVQQMRDKLLYAIKAGAGFDLS